MFALDLRLQKTSSRCLQGVLVRINIFVLAIRLQDVFKTFRRRLQNVFKISSRRLAKTSSRHLQKVFKTSWKTSLRHLQDVFKMHHPVKLFLLTRLWEAFNTLLINLWSVYKICKRDKNFPIFSFSLYYTF